ncbi:MULTISPECIES: hypothetical protein [unclassified Streptomyces]|uniref:hypothetical protein n=1 Tax=unclassified Streptomyces TaxID=2593676 RepID=UPI0038100C36
MRIPTILAAVALAGAAVLGGASLATADDHGGSHGKSLLSSKSDGEQDKGFLPDILRDLGLVGE